MTETIPIESLQEGDEFTGFYALRRCELKEYDGGFRMDIELSDKSGSVPGVIWDDAYELRNTLAKGEVVKVKGRLLSYRDMPQVRVDKIRCAEVNEYDSQSFLPSTPKDIEALKARALECVESIQEPTLKKLAVSIFHNERFMEKFTRAPGGMRWHHPYLGGLLEHSMGVTEICDFIAGCHPELNRDLLILAALLHDIGKIMEYSATTMIDFTDEGRLEGHIVMGERFVRNMCEKIDDFPAKLKMLLSHLMLSHQGYHKFSTPVEPMIPEGFVLYYADEMDSKLNALGRITDSARSEGKQWSDYVKLLERFIYVDGEETPE